MNWRDLGTRKSIELVPFVLNYLQEKPETKLFIGTDSQRRRKRVVYATVVVLYNEKKGGKVIYAKMITPPIKDNFTRLFKEVELSIEIANTLLEAGIQQSLMAIDLDFNEDRQYFSNKLLTSALGWATALGFTCRTKPKAVAASYASDRLVKGF